MAAAVEVAGPPELPVYLTGMPILDVIMEMFLPVDVIHVGIVAEAGVVLAENMVEDLLRIVGSDSARPTVPEPILEIDHTGRYIQLSINRFPKNGEQSEDNVARRGSVAVYPILFT